MHRVSSSLETSRSIRQIRSTPARVRPFSLLSSPLPNALLRTSEPSLTSSSTPSSADFTLLVIAFTSHNPSHPFRLLSRFLRRRVSPLFFPSSRFLQTHRKLVADCLSVFDFLCSFTRLSCLPNSTFVVDGPRLPTRRIFVRRLSISFFLPLIIPRCSNSVDLPSFVLYRFSQPSRSCSRIFVKPRRKTLGRQGERGSSSFRLRL